MEAFERASSVFIDKNMPIVPKIRIYDPFNSHTWRRNVESHNEPNVKIAIDAARTRNDNVYCRLKRWKEKSNSKVNMRKKTKCVTSYKLKWNWTRHGPRRISKKLTTRITLDPTRSLEIEDHGKPAGEMTSTSSKKPWHRKAGGGTTWKRLMSNNGF